MAFNSGLLDNRSMRLAVPIRAVLWVRIRSQAGMIASLLHFPVVVMLPGVSLRISALGQEVLSKLKSVYTSGGRVETEKSQLDLRVTGVALDLVWAWPELFPDEADVLLDGRDQQVIAIVVSMGNGSFDKVSGVVTAQSKSATTASTRADSRPLSLTAHAYL